jgi:hypothetical protein
VAIAFNVSFFSETPSFGLVRAAIVEPGSAPRYGGFQFGRRSGNNICISIIHRRIIIHQIIFFWLEIDRINLCVGPSMQGGGLSEQGGLPWNYLA